MALKRQLIINATDSNDNEVVTTISNINPSEDISKATLRQAATTLNNLTRNTLVSIQVVNTEDITTATE